MVIKGQARIINKIKNYSLLGRYTSDGHYVNCGKKITVMLPSTKCKCKILNGEFATDVNGFNFKTLDVRGDRGTDKFGNVFEVIG